MTIILIAHSKKLSDQVKDFIKKMITGSNEVEVLTSGFNVDGGLGNNPEEISNLIKNASSDDILLICDLGSSVFASISVKEMFEDKNIAISSGPFVEGAFAAYSAASSGQSFSKVLEASNNFIPKL